MNIRWLEWISQGVVIAGAAFTALAFLFRNVGQKMVYSFMDQRYVSLKQAAEMQLKNDADRMRLEQRIKELHEHIDSRHNDTKDRIDDVKNDIGEVKNDIISDIRELRQQLFPRHRS
jgi:hypothetical protein